MKRFLSVVAVLALWTTAAFAETDYPTKDVIKDIQRGVDSPNQIDVLRVRTSATIPAAAVGSLDATGAISGGSLAVSGASTFSGATKVIAGGTTNPVVTSPSDYVGPVLVQLGSCTNGQAITFSDSFAAPPAVVIGAEAAGTTNENWYVTGLTSSGFTAHGQDGVPAGYIAVGLR